jgi:hypothetical protein
VELRETTFKERISIAAKQPQGSVLSREGAYGDAEYHRKDSIYGKEIAWLDHKGTAVVEREEDRHQEEIKQKKDTWKKVLLFCTV